MLSKDVKVVI